MQSLLRAPLSCHHSVINFTWALWQPCEACNVDVTIFTILQKRKTHLWQLNLNKLILAARCYTQDHLDPPGRPVTHPHSRSMNVSCEGHKGSTIICGKYTCNHLRRKSCWHFSLPSTTFLLLSILVSELPVWYIMNTIYAVLEFMFHSILKGEINKYKFYHRKIAKHSH
jgi:hypothetical protein